MIAAASFPIALSGPKRQLCLRSTTHFLSGERSLAAAPQISAKTEPGSTEESWEASPSRISRARAGKIRSTRLIRWISTIEASSMISTLARSRSDSLLLSQRWTVPTSTTYSASRPIFPCIPRRALRVASCRREAALPVGAAKTISFAPAWPTVISANMIFATVVVFPVPGPPEMQHKWRLSAACAALRGFTLRGSSPNKSSSKACSPVESGVSRQASSHSRSATDRSRFHMRLR